MNQELSINFGAPYLTIEKFSEVYGMEVNTVKSWIKQGKLPVRKRALTGSRSIVLINNAALTIEALKADHQPIVNV